jgi:hypothetical protein
LSLEQEMIDRQIIIMERNFFIGLSLRIQIQQEYSKFG